ncbi:MAG: ethanolamine utilization protein EutN [Deltaproteobacteria bacterium]|nr:ethanolamine utilization protein EutN [Deltaproteobacteria bacterium]
MIRGRVIGEVWATKKLPPLAERKLLLVAELGKGEEGFAPTGRVVVAYDRLGAQPGHEVVVSFGSGARNVIQTGGNRNILMDAAVAQVIDSE